MFQATDLSGRRGGFAPLLVLLMTAAAATASAQDRAQGFAAISIQPAALDFGMMERNQTRTKELTIRNDGGIDLDILDVATSCGCTVAETGTRKLKPGEATTLTVTFSSGEFQGPQHKIMTIRSNDVATPSLEIPVNVIVHVPVVVNPQRQLFAFTHARRGATEERQAYFTAMDIPRLELKAERVRSDLFDIKIQNGVDGDPRQGIVTLSVRPDAPYGPINEVVRIGTNDPNQPSIDFEVVGAVLHDLDVNPDQVNLRYLERDKPITRELRVTSTVPGLKFKVTGAQIDLPEFKVTVEERIPDKETVIVLRGAPIATTDPRAIASAGRLQGTLRIFTNHPTQPELQVKVTYLLRL
ncbi:MAG: DUF1573 domain-containing protein [Candidatus Krumholzibacteriia bacterium]